jgi:predicted nucleotidyltransferase
MDRTRVLDTLRQHEAELKASGVLHLRLFGSVARGDQTDISDIDLMAEVDPAQRLTLVKLARLQNTLSDLLGARVDLAVSGALRAPVRSRAQGEALLAF